MNKKKLVFATNNPHKLQEARRIISDDFEIVSLEQIGCHDDIPETAETLEGNALIKARWIKEKYGYDCFADDTGLMVDALGGAPGVYSARYAGEHCTPADNVRKLLEEMRDEPSRSARFSTVVALIADGGEHVFDGSVEGYIATAPSGSDGFGYDPVFIERESGKTFAEMAPEEKNAVSHRGRAMRKLRDFLALIILALLAWAAPGARAQEWRLVPSYDGKMVNIAVSPEFVYFLGASQEFSQEGNQFPLYGVLFRYDIEHEELRYLNSQNLLSGNVVKAIAYNQDKKYLAVALADGTLNLLYDNGKTVYIPGLSIADSSLDRTVNGITFDSKNNIYLATNFGYVVASDALHEIVTSKIFGKKINSCAAMDGRLWLGTDDGLFYGSPDDFTMENFRQVDGAGKTNSIAVLGDRNIYVCHGSSWALHVGTILNPDSEPAFRNLTAQTVNGACHTKNYYTVVSNGGITLFDTAGESRSLPLPEGYANSIASTADGRDFWFSSGRSGISLLSAPSSGSDKWTVRMDKFLPNASNAFMSMSMAYHPDYGMLVRNHGYELAFSDRMMGVYDLISGYKDASWTPLSTTYRCKDGLLIDNPWGVAIDPQNKDHIYCGSVRSGLFRLDLKNPDNSLQFSHPTDIYGNEKRDGFIAVVPDNPPGTWRDQCVFAAPVFDSSSNLWTAYVDPVANLPEGVANHAVICAWTPEDRRATVSAPSFRKWKQFDFPSVTVGNFPKVLPLKSSGSRNTVLFYGNTKSTPLLIFDHNGTLDVTGDDQLVRMKNIYDQDGNEIPFYNIYEMYEDTSTGLVWVAYDTGIFTFNPAEALQNKQTARKIKVPRNDGTNLADYLLEGVKVNSITSDGAGRKWFGTKGAGLVCTSADGRKILETYTAEDSPLPGNSVYAVCYNPDSNSMMVSTEFGLCEIFLSRASDSAGSSEVRCSPNPVRPDYYGVVTIDGLEDDAMVKIVDTAGNLVKECGQAVNGTVVWNVTNLYSKRVPGGVYFVLASNGPNSDSYAKVSKILVVE